MASLTPLTRHLSIALRRCSPHQCLRLQAQQAVTSWHQRSHQQQRRTFADRHHQLTSEEREIMDEYQPKVDQEDVEAQAATEEDYYIPNPPPNLEDDDEFDPDMPEWNNDDVSSVAHMEIEQHREFRHYARLAMWEMPKLAKFRKPFEPPSNDELLRFRYTSYMGVQHPAESKVVMEIDVKKLDFMLSKEDKLTFLKLVGTRYNPGREVVKMSCEMFETQAQNKRYLSDLFDTLINEAKNGKDKFADIPLDLRHYKPKTKLRFPDAWKRLPEEILEKRRQDWQAAPANERDEMIAMASEHLGRQVTL